MQGGAFRGKAAFKGETGAGQRHGGLPADVIKIIAIVSMLIDHTGAIFQGYINPDLYTLMRAVGRLAFPLFAFFIVEGFTHTRSVRNYLLRLAVFAGLSEIPFDYAFFSWSGRLFYWGHQNVFVTLTLGLAAIWLLDIVRTRIVSMNFLPHLAQLLLTVLVIFASATVADLLGGDYGHMGILLMLLFYMVRGNKLGQVLALTAWLLFYDYSIGRVTELYAIVDILPILFYNGKKGTLPVPKLLFYGFYPVHLLLLAWIRSYLG